MGLDAPCAQSAHCSLCQTRGIVLIKLISLVLKIVTELNTTAHLSDHNQSTIAI